MEIIINDNYDEICAEAFQIIFQEWQRNQKMVLGCATGRTPLGVYAKLIDAYKNEKMDFAEMRAFNLDEYYGLEENHPQSFAFYMNKNFYSQVNIKTENIFTLHGLAEDIDTHCRQYEALIRDAGGIDIQLLGIGTNGHIGFNEPSSSLSSRTRAKTLTMDTIEINRRFFNNRKDIPRYCLTMGVGTILDARTILLLAFGKSKDAAVAECVEGPVTASVPASALQLHPDVKIILDEDAASRLTRKDYYRWVYNNKRGITQMKTGKKPPPP